MAKTKRPEGRKPNLDPKMSVADFTDHYWLKTEIEQSARQLDLPTHGYKPELSARIEQRLREMLECPPTKPRKSKGARDSDKPMRD